MTIPDEPTSQSQMYRLTAKGRAVLRELDTDSDRAET